jgi:ParB family transcriptional regulator, chromosome partitioning protein
MPRDLQHIPLADLKVSKLNVRKHGAKDIDSLAASIAAIGVIQPLLVRKNCEGFDVVAGQRRYLAARKLAAAEHSHADPLPCMVLAADDDAAAIEASLAENIERLPMDEMDQYEAFARLRAKGLDEAAIAGHFGISEQIVKRRLALAKLDPDIRRLYRADEIDAQTLHLLTLATRERQKAWLALAAEQDAPPPWQLKAWLLGGAEIATSAALFDEAQYDGAIVADLFGEERFFADPDAFWRLQNAAIAETRDRLLASGWSEVHVLEPDTRFDTWDYESVTKADRGAVYIEVEGDGHVTIRKGLRPKRKGASQRGRGASEPDEGSATAERPEMTQALASYVDLVRHSAVRLAVARTPKVALRLLVAHAIGGAKWWKVEAERQTPHSEAIGAAIASLPTHAAFAALREEVASTLGLDSDTATLVANDGCGARTAAVFVKLLEIPDKDVNRLLAVVMAETLAVSTALIDTLGQQLVVDIGAAWQPDETFFDLLRDRETLGAMLAEMIGKRAADSYLTATGTAKKDIMRKALAGDGRSKVTGWLPRYMAFPQGAYTQRPQRSERPPTA